MAEAPPAESALSPLLHALSMAAGGASAQPAAGDAIDVPAESEPSLLLRALAGDPLRAIVQLLGDADLPCFRLVCRACRDHSSKPEKKCVVDFFRTPALAVFAWERMPGFVLALPTMLFLAVSVGCEEVIEELVDNRQCALSADTCATVAAKGHLGALAWLHSRGCPWTSETCYRAARGGYLEVLRYAHEHGCPWDYWTCDRAAEGGHLEVLRYAHEHGCPWDRLTCRCASAEGHLEVLRYAHEQGCPWDSATCHLAAEGGHLEVLRYAHEHGCSWDSSTCYGAAAGGYLEVLRYAHEHGCPWHWEDCLSVALQKGYAEVAEYLRATQPAA
jgi:hypothetical protein